MRRREFIGLIGGAAAAWPMLAQAQNTNKASRRIVPGHFRFDRGKKIGLSAFVTRPCDRAQFARSTPEMKKWFNDLKSEIGPCCADADGTALSDVDWESKNGHYRVRLNGQWIDVPDDALVTAPNLAGRTMVWPMPQYEFDTIRIRCFLPGPMI